MAEAYLKKLFSRSKGSSEVRSAGTLGICGAPPSREAIKVIMEEGIETDGFVSKALTEDLIEWADVVLVMEQMHKDRILHLVPDAEEKVRFLGEFDHDRKEVCIPDPIGRPMSFYRASFDIIKRSIQEFKKWMRE